MKIFVPKEIVTNEKRVATTPDVASSLGKLGFEISIESNAGLAAGFLDQSYLEAGVAITTHARQGWSDSEIILKVRAPTQHPVEDFDETNIKNYIDGSFASSCSDTYIDIYNPSTGKIYAQCPDSSREDLEVAIKGAESAFVKWSNLNQEERSTFLFSLADIIEDELDEFAIAESTDNGKPVTLSKSLDIPRSIKNLRFFAELAMNQNNLVFHQKNIVSKVLKQSLGVVGTISPWNLPLYLFTWKVAPALVSGNCVIAKPSEVTPYTAYLSSKACIKAKFPKGVLNVIHGSGEMIGAEIVKHKRVKAISFTGGTKTGKAIAKVAAYNIKRISLEMGGKNPVLIFDDCNYNKMLESLLKSSFFNQGQICLAGSRIYVQDTIYEKFNFFFFNF